jgi:hypothetical protein
VYYNRKSQDPSAQSNCISVRFHSETAKEVFFFGKLHTWGYYTKCSRENLSFSLYRCNTIHTNLREIRIDLYRLSQETSDRTETLTRPLPPPSVKVTECVQVHLESPPRLHGVTPNCLPTHTTLPYVYHIEIHKSEAIIEYLMNYKANCCPNSVQSIMWSGKMYFKIDVFLDLTYHLTLVSLLNMTATDVCRIVKTAF